jgi:hypothetical protein
MHGVYSSRVGAPFEDRGPADDGKAIDMQKEERTKASTKNMPK